MPGFRNRRTGLLILALLLSGLFITAPWKGSQPEGAPLPDVAKGPNWGIDITGGSRIMLRLEATQATIELPPQVSANYAENIRRRFRRSLETPVKKFAENIARTRKFILEIGKYVSENTVDSLLKKGKLVGDVKKTVSQFTREEVKNSLKTRVDPYGTLSAQFKPMGEEYLQFEVALDLERAKKLLGKEGLPEVFIDNRRIIWSKHIRNPDRRHGRRGWVVSFTLTDPEGQKRFADYTGRKVPDKTGHPGVIYLDRPTDSILLFTKEFEKSLEDEPPVELAEGVIENADFSESAGGFRFKTRNITRDRPATPYNEAAIDQSWWFYIPIPAAKIKENEVPTNSRNYILSLKENREINRALLLGKKKNFSNVLGDNLIIDNKALLPLENTTKLSKEELYTQWLIRVSGLKSWPWLTPSITGNVENLGRGLTISTGSGEEGKAKAEDLRIVLSQRLPVEVTHISEEHIGRRLGKEFLKEAAMAAIAAFIVVGVLVFSFYRKFKIAIPLLLTMASEVVITLGAASAVPDGLMSIGLPGLGGLIAVVGTGVDHQIIITDEVLGEKLSKSGRIPIDRRTGRAFTIIFAAAATTIAAMIALATFGFGAMRGFAIVTLFGVLVSVLITRPAYARIIGTLLEREQKKKSGGR